MKKLLYSFLLLQATFTYAQDPEFSQFYANPLYLNPALAGMEPCPRFILNHRDQWPAITGVYITTSLSYDQNIKNFGGLGILLTHDEAGGGNIIATTNASAIYSFRKNLTNKISFSMALQGGYAEKVVDWTKLTFGDQIDENRGFVFSTNETERYSRKANIDFSSGFLIYSDRLFGGFAVHHLTQPDEFLHSGPAPLPRKYTAHAGARLKMPGYRQKGNYISPNILYQQQQDFRQVNLGLYLQQGYVVWGFWYRGAVDAFIALIGFQKDNFKIGYSYDLTVSKIAPYTGGAHELSMAFRMRCKPRKKNYRPDICPSF